MGLHLDGRQASPRIDSGAYLVLQENVDQPKIQQVLFPDLDKWLNE